jgi:hypothetical protein
LDSPSGAHRVVVPWSDMHVMRPGPSSPLWLALAAVAVWWWMQASFGSSGVRVAGLSGAELEDSNRRHRNVSFSDLGAFEYRPRLPAKVAAALREPGESIPPSIRALDGLEVRIDGFMLPTVTDKTGVREFILNANYDMCAFGAPPVITQQVTVRMAGERRAPFTHLPVRVFGRFAVGEENSGGRLVSLYRLTATALASNGV